MVLSGGTVRTGNWLRNTRTDGIALFADDGTVIELLPGRTWVELRDPVDPRSQRSPEAEPTHRR